MVTHMASNSGERCPFAAMLSAQTVTRQHNDVEQQRSLKQPTESWPTRMSRSSTPKQAYDAVIRRCTNCRQQHTKASSAATHPELIQAVMKSVCHGCWQARSDISDVPRHARATGGDTCSRSSQYMSTHHQSAAASSRCTKGSKPDERASTCWQCWYG
jgi:hypothetical protein